MDRPSYWNHNSAYYPWVVTKTRGHSRVLDAGCGNGELALLLARDGHRVMGIDPSEECIAEAKARVGSEDAHFTCAAFEDFAVEQSFDAEEIAATKESHEAERPSTTAEAFTAERASDAEGASNAKRPYAAESTCQAEKPFAAEQPFDAIVFVASLHHMDMGQAIAKAKALLAPGGIIAVVGLASPSSFLDHVVDLLRILPSWASSRLHRMRSSEELGIPTSYDLPTMAQVRELASEQLPGATIRHGLHWRYLLLWQEA